MKQRNDEKQALAHFGVDKNSRSNYSLLDYFHNEPVLKKVKEDMHLVVNEFRNNTKLQKPPFILHQIRKTK